MKEGFNKMKDQIPKETYKKALTRKTFGKTIAEHDIIQCGKQISDKLDYWYLKVLSAFTQLIVIYPKENIRITWVLVKERKRSILSVSYPLVLAPLILGLCSQNL